MWLLESKSFKGELNNQQLEGLYAEHFSHHSKHSMCSNRNDVRYVPVNIQAPTPISRFTRSQISQCCVTLPPAQVSQKIHHCQRSSRFNDGQSRTETLLNLTPLMWLGVPSGPCFASTFASAAFRESKPNFFCPVALQSCAEGYLKACCVNAAVAMHWQTLSLSCAPISRHAG